MTLCVPIDASIACKYCVSCTCRSQHEEIDLVSEEEIMSRVPDTVLVRYKDILVASGCIALVAGR